MIQVGTKLKTADNTGAKKVQVIGILGGSRKKYAYIGDIVTITVKDAEPRSQVKKGDKLKAVIVRQRKEFKRKDGTYIRFDENACVIVEGFQPKGARIFGPIPRELKEKGFTTIVSLAKHIV